MSKVDVEDPDSVAEAFKIPRCLAAEIEYENDDDFATKTTMTPEQGGLLEIPPFVKGEMRKHMAFDRLIRAAKALLDENTDCAKSSYSNPGERFTDANWKAEDAENFKVCREVRNALREATRCFPTVPNPDCGGK